MVPGENNPAIVRGRQWESRPEDVTNLWARKLTPERPDLSLRVYPPDPVPKDNKAIVGTTRSCKTRARMSTTVVREPGPICDPSSTPSCQRVLDYARTRHGPIPQ
jgi:hypothetical protein